MERIRSGVLTKRARPLDATWCRPLRLRGSADDGVTLLELLVTLAILGIVALVSFPAMRGSWTTANIDASSRSIAAGLRAAREKALSTRTVVVVVLDAGRDRLLGPDGEIEAGLSAIDRVSVQSEKGPVRGGSLDIRFHPDGGSSGAVILLESGASRRIITVDWLSGAVGIER